MIFMYFLKLLYPDICFPLEYGYELQMKPTQKSTTEKIH